MNQHVSVALWQLLIVVMSDIAAPLTEKAETTSKRRLEKLAQAGLAGAVVIECIIFAFYSATFLTTANAINVALQVSVTAILAIGMTLVILTGGIDLSIGSLVAVCGILAAQVARGVPGVPLLAGTIIAVMAGGAIGA